MVVLRKIVLREKALGRGPRVWISRKMSSERTIAGMYDKRGSVTFPSYTVKVYISQSAHTRKEEHAFNGYDIIHF